MYTLVFLPIYNVYLSCASYSFKILQNQNPEKKEPINYMKQKKTHREENVDKRGPWGPSYSLSFGSW